MLHHVPASWLKSRCWPWDGSAYSNLAGTIERPCRLCQPPCCHCCGGGLQPVGLTTHKDRRVLQARETVLTILLALRCIVQCRPAGTVAESVGRALDCSLNEHCPAWGCAENIATAHLLRGAIDGMTLSRRSGSFPGSLKVGTAGGKLNVLVATEGAGLAYL